MHSAIVFAPDADEREIYIEPAERHLMHVLLDFCSGVRHALFELGLVHGISACATLFVLFVRELEHRVEISCERRQVRSLL